MNIKSGFYLLFCFILTTIAACKKDPQPINRNEELSDVSTYSSSVAEEWINTIRNVVATNSINPPRAARAYAYIGITIYESVVDGISGNRSLQGQLNGFPLNSISQNTDSLDYIIVMNEALSIVAKCDTIFAGISQASKNEIDTLHTIVLRSRNMALDSIIVKSKARGALVAEAIKRYAAQDSFQTIRTWSYTVPPRDALHLWYWEPTDGAHLNPVEPYWGHIRPFVLSSANEMEIPQAVSFSVDTTSAFGRQAREVLVIVENKTTEQNNIVVWWRDQSNTQTPAGHWMGILQYVLHQKNYKLDKAAELYALVGITAADAFISCWDAKYKYNLLRPETYIRAYMKPSWTTGQGSDITPPFPEYPSGHSVCSGAAAEILTSLLGTVSFTDSINIPYGYMPRSFSSFNAAADEAALSRLYGGIHYRDAIQNGLVQGKIIAQKINNSIQLR